MTLSTRVSLYFLGSLGIVLIGFSLTVYLLATRYLERQVDERLEGAVNTIAAAAEIKEDSVEWEPDERRLSFGRRTLEGTFAWSVTTPDGEFVDGMKSSATDRWFTTKGTALKPQTVHDDSTGDWRILRHPLLPRQGASTEFDRRGTFHPSLVIHAAISLQSLRETLRKLAILLVAISATMGALALAFCRRLTRRALRPLNEMAEFAHSISSADHELRLPNPDQNDELGELGRSFNALLDRLNESYERQRRFTGEASHQLRTPLAVVQGQVDLALRHDRPVEEYQRVLRLVQKKTRNLKQIVESLLFLARASAETSQPDLETIDLALWFPEFLQNWTHPRHADLEIRQEATGPLFCRIHPVLLGELLSNLLDNAAKYSAPESEIAVRLTSEENIILLSIKDHGIGIREDDLPHLFENFYRSDDARKGGKTGVGLGLAVASRLATMFGGTIAVESRFGLGSCFQLRLPRLVVSEPQALATADSGSPAHGPI